MRTVRLCLLGFGHVTRRLCELLDERAAELAADHGLAFLVVAVGTASHGSLLLPAGLAPGSLLEISEPSPAGWALPDPEVPGGRLIAASGADCLIEATPLETAGAATAIGHVETALRHGMDVVTVNKGPIAYDYRRLADLAHETGRQLRFEGITMDGAPVYNLVELCLPGARVLGFDGVLNSTSNYVLDAMADGRSFSEALAAAVAAGFAEADPAHDIDGWDAAEKVAALANVLMDARTTPDHVARESIRGVTAERTRRVRAADRRIRVVCSARRDADGLRLEVQVREVGPDDPFYAVNGSSSMLTLHTDLMGDISITERDGLLTQTAYAVYADLLTIYRRPRVP